MLACVIIFYALVAFGFALESYLEGEREDWLGYLACSRFWSLPGLAASHCHRRAGGRPLQTNASVSSGSIDLIGF